MKINEDFIKDKIDNDCVLVPTGDKYQNGVFVLNETAEKIFDLLKDGKSRDEIVAALADEYDSELADIESSTDEFIAKLREVGIVTDA